MKKFVKNLESRYLLILLFLFGILLVIFPDFFYRAFPWMLGIELIIHGLTVIYLSVKYREESKGPGRAVPYIVMGVGTIILGSDATGIIGVIWAVFTLNEVSEDINLMWKEKHISVITTVTAVISVVLAVMLMIDPFEHFVFHIRILGLEVIFSCLSRYVEFIKSFDKSAS